MTDDIEYTILKNKIHSFKWYKSTHATINQFVTMITDIMRDLPEESTLCILHDYTATGVPLFSTMAHAMKRIDLSCALNIKIAHLYSHYAHRMVVQNAALITSFTPVNRQFFKEDKKDKAIQWLLSDN